ncbi:protein-L-isoaspartate(D-aspartate) O-methyltransferase [Candidatus Woesearchaeota archaeon]|nr:protein-L-isoaspartate(D-aspartate) O-methyltransferase [Candidatus Woesearchaeota archaeon]
MKDYKNELLELIDEIKGMGISNESVLNAISEVPRHLFIRKQNMKEAYGNYPLPIGYGQTISQPFTVAFMLGALEVKPGQKILEIGAGSGYNAAVLSKLVGDKGRVYSIEIVSELADFAINNLKKIGIKNVQIIGEDGSIGYQKEKPYDRIIITAGCPEIPKPLIQQLKDKGVIVAPVESFFGQEMIKLTKEKDTIKIKKLGSFTFVPLRGKHGYD